MLVGISFMVLANVFADNAGQVDWDFFIHHRLTEKAKISGKLNLFYNSSHDYPLYMSGGYWLGMFQIGADCLTGNRKDIVRGGDSFLLKCSHGGTLDGIAKPAVFSGYDSNEVKSDNRSELEIAGVTSNFEIATFDADGVTYICPLTEHLEVTAGIRVDADTLSDDGLIWSKDWNNNFYIDGYKFEVVYQF